MDLDLRFLEGQPLRLRSALTALGGIAFGFGMLSALKASSRQAGSERAYLEERLRRQPGG